MRRLLLVLLTMSLMAGSSAISSAVYVTNDAAFWEEALMQANAECNGIFQMVNRDGKHIRENLVYEYEGKSKALFVYGDASESEAWLNSRGLYAGSEAPTDEKRTLGFTEYGHPFPNPNYNVAISTDTYEEKTYPS